MQPTCQYALVSSRCLERQEKGGVLETWQRSLETLGWWFWEAKLWKNTVKANGHRGKPPRRGKFSGKSRTAQGTWKAGALRQQCLLPAAETSAAMSLTRNSPPRPPQDGARDTRSLPDTREP